MVDAVTYILENDATVSSLVGQNAAASKSKVYPVVAPQSETAPYITVRVVGKERPAKNCDFNYTIQVTSWANSYDAATDLDNAVYAALEGQASGTVNGVDFGFLNLVGGVDDYSKDHNLYGKITTLEGMANI